MSPASNINYTNRYQPVTYPDDDFDTQTVFTANDEVKKAVNESKNVSKSLVKELKEVVYTENESVQKSQVFESFVRQSSSRLSTIKRDLDN